MYITPLQQTELTIDNFCGRQSLLSANLHSPCKEHSIELRKASNSLTSLHLIWTYCRPPNQVRLFFQKNRESLWLHSNLKLTTLRALDSSHTNLSSSWPTLRTTPSRAASLKADSILLETPFLLEGRCKPFPNQCPSLSRARNSTPHCLTIHPILPSSPKPEDQLTLLPTLTQASSFQQTLKT